MRIQKYLAVCTPRQSLLRTQAVCHPVYLLDRKEGYL